MDESQCMAPLEAELRRLGAWQLEAYRSLRPEDVHVKRDARGETSVVTQHDLETEVQLRTWIEHRFPSHSFLGEETGHAARDTEHYWLVDPIDGTSNFASGLPFWGTSVGYWHRGEPRLGLVYFPALDRMFSAWRGGGACENGRRIRTPSNRSYTMLDSVALDSRSHLRHALRLRARVRILGSAVANFCFTANGIFLASATKARLWDVGAGLVILEEAGAVVDCTPGLEALEPSLYARDGDPGEPIHLFARANADLEPLSEHLVAVPPR